MSPNNLMARRHAFIANSDARPVPERLIFGRSAAMQEVRRSVDGVASQSVPVLLLGEPGAGKESVAREIHRRSPWCLTPFKKLSASDNTALSADAAGQCDRDLLLRHTPQAVPPSGCTLFIEEVAKLAAPLQIKLLELFHEQSSARSNPELRKSESARVICSSSKNLADEINSGSFRLDLFYRINVVTIHVPPLRDRKEDIPDLVEYFFQLSCLEQNSSCPRLTANLLRLFCQHDWPGNIRELDNCVRTYVESGGDAELVEALVCPRKERPAESEKSERRENRIPLKAYTRQLVEQAEKDLILRVLREQRWNRKEAAKVLQVSYQTLLHKLKQTGLTRKRRVQPDVVDQTVQE